MIDASFPGTYTARNVSSIGCLSDESDEIIRTIGVEELEKLGFTISPNPSDGTIKLHISEQIEPENLQIRIINALGQTIEFESSTESQDISIQWDGPTGNYLLEIKTPSGLYRFTLIKQD
ncbi:T9SS type A sorting domain-containing protein [bacterium]|nr:T9SS type A sorting domain-containing protein [bacterium]